MRSIIILLCSVVFIACAKTESVSAPDNILSPNQFEDILTEVQLIEAHMNEVRVNQIINRDSTYIFYNEIFQKHNITPKQFEEAIAYYSGIPDQFRLIYENVLEKLSIMEASLGDIETEEIPINQIGKTKMIEIISKEKIGELFLNDSILNQDIIRDSVFKYFQLNDTIFDKYHTNVESFQHSYHILSQAGFQFLSFRESIRKKISSNNTKK